MDGAVSGITTYAAQVGAFTRIGNLVTVQVYISISAATGTGNLVIGGLPFTIKNVTNGFPFSGVFWQGTASWTFPTGTTSLSTVGVVNTTTAKIYASGSAVAGGFMQMANAALAVGLTMTYQI